MYIACCSLENERRREWDRRMYVFRNEDQIAVKIGRKRDGDDKNSSCQKTHKRVASPQVF